VTSGVESAKWVLLGPPLAAAVEDPPNDWGFAYAMATDGDR